MSAGCKQERQMLLVTSTECHNIPEFERHNGIVGMHVIDVFGLQKLRRSFVANRQLFERSHNIDAQLIPGREIVIVHQHPHTGARQASLPAWPEGGGIEQKLI